MIFSKKKSRYIAGWEIDFTDPDQLTKILMTQGIDKNGFELFSRIQSATEIIIRGKKIIEVIQHSYGSIESNKTDYKLPINKWVDRSPFYLHKDLNGSHSIGGKKPENFELPFNKELKSTFVYIATINGKDPLFNWINLEELHIAYPLYEGGFEIFLDYQNPNAPSIINPEIFTYSWIDEKVKGVEKVEFVHQNYIAKQQFNLQEVEDNDDDFLLSGVPLWYQYPQIPTCPKTGKVMQYVTTFNSDKSLSVNSNPDIENLPFGDYLIFGDYGHLYVFYEPDSKVLFLNVQF